MGLWVQGSEVQGSEVQGSEVRGSASGPAGGSAQPLAAEVYPPQEGGQFDRKRNFVVSEQS